MTEEEIDKWAEERTNEIMAAINADPWLKGCICMVPIFLVMFIISIVSLFL